MGSIRVHLEYQANLPFQYQSRWIFRSGRMPNGRLPLAGFPARKSSSAEEPAKAWPPRKVIWFAFTLVHLGCDFG